MSCNCCKAKRLIIHLQQAVVHRGDASTEVYSVLRRLTIKAAVAGGYWPGPVPNLDGSPLP